MAKAAAKASPRRTSTTITRGNVPIGRTNMVPPPPPTPGPKPEPTPQEQEKLIQRGTLMAVLYAEVGSYAKVAEMFDVAQSTVRWWVHETRKRNAKELQKITDRLRGDVAQLAVDRVLEGLVEGGTEFAAMLGTKVLHGLGELKAHSAIKNDLPPGDMKLTFVFERRDPSQPAVEVIEGAVLGVPDERGTVQPSAEAD